MIPGIQNSVSKKVSVNQLMKTVLVNRFDFQPRAEAVYTVVISWSLCVGRQEFTGRGGPLGVGGS